MVDRRDKGASVFTGFGIGGGKSNLLRKWSAMLQTLALNGPSSIYPLGLTETTICNALAVLRSHFPLR